LAEILNIDAPLDDATEKRLVVGALEVPWTLRRDTGVVVPTPNLLFTLSQNRLALFWLREPPVEKNGMEPAVKLVKVVEAKVGDDVVPMA
jgi:hypothetical protein